MERLSQHLQKVREIQSAVLTTRNDFISQYRRGQMGSKLLTYEPKLDQGVYATLKRYEDIPEQPAYIHARNELNEQTRFSVETFIGERLNVGLSQFRYDVRDGKMYGAGMDEPLVDMIQRGRDCRDAIARDVDKPRQDAEIEQFTKIQDIFGNPHTAVGTTVVSISPPGGPGSSYAHNFYDVFVLSEDEATSNRFIAARRYSSTLSLTEYQEKAQQLVPTYLAEHKNEPMDSYFLSHPLVISHANDLSGDPEAIHAFMQNGHEFLSTEDFAAVRRSIAGLITSYINTLVNTPDDELLLHSTLNVIMNSADHVADNLRRPHLREHMLTQEPLQGPVSRADMLKEGKKPVRSVATGCGDSSGFGTGNNLASNMSETFSMRDFGSDKYGSRTFDCPECGEMNVRPLNELVKNCQYCGSGKVSC